MNNQPAWLALEDGTLLKGEAFGYVCSSPMYSVGEIVFNTSLSGYQEILTDPSYSEQLITLTYPQIGNVGVNPEDHESKKIHAKGLIIRKLTNCYSNWRAKGSLTSFLKQHKILGISNIDTRYLTKLIREKGAMNACLFSAPQMTDEIVKIAIDKAKAFPGLEGQNLAKVVTTSSAYVWQEGGSWPNKTANLKKSFRVVALDFGVKKNILRILQDLGCEVTVVPYETTADQILALNPNGVFLSNGPGDPKACDIAIHTIQRLIQEEIPLFGICLGHQLLALSLGAKTFKMKFGHHGGNHPVQDIQSKRVLITSQNHGFSVDEENLPDSLMVTHRSLFDQTLQGLKHKTLPIFGFQGHPEASPGPNDARLLFNPFIEAMRVYQAHMQKTTQDMVTD